MNTLSLKVPNALSRGLRLCVMLACLSLVAACGDSPPADGGDTGSDTGGDTGGDGGGSGNTSCSASSSTPCPPPCPPDLSGIQKQYDDAQAKLDEELKHELDNADSYKRNADAELDRKLAADHAANESNLAQGLITKDEWTAKMEQIRDYYQEQKRVVADEANDAAIEAYESHDAKSDELERKRDADIAGYEAFCAGSDQSSQGSNRMTPVTDQNHTIGMCDSSKGGCSPI